MNFDIFQLGVLISKQQAKIEGSSAKRYLNPHLGKIELSIIYAENMFPHLIIAVVVRLAKYNVYRVHN